MGVVATIHGQGTAESDWQQCSWLWTQPPTPAQKLFGSARRLVVVAPHPDDEVLGCGGLMRLAVEAGLDVQVAAVTDGEACYPHEKWWTPERLRQVRRDELRAALAELGIGDAWHLGIADGGVSADVQRLHEWLQDMLRADDLVLAPWRLDGHPDHEAAGDVAYRCAQATGCRFLQYPVWGWHWLHPDAVHITWGKPRLVDISAVQARKQRAIACFRSQTGEVEHLQSDPILPPHVLQRFARGHEVFLA